MNAIAVLQLFALSALVLAVASGVFVSLLTPAALRQVASWSPERRFRALLVVALSPTVLSVIGLVAVSVPSLLALARPNLDHCLHHGDGHGHICFLHPPHHLGGVMSWAVLAVAAAWGIARTTRGVAAFRRAHHVARGLLAFGVRDAATGAFVVPTKAPFCLSLGLVHPVIVLSKGVIDALTADELSVVLRHEEAHVARRDTLLRLSARLCTLFMLPGVRKRLLDSLELAAEQSCDEAASVATNRLSVAETILRVERMLGASAATLRPLATPFGEYAIEARVSALVAEPARGGRSGLVLSALLVMVAALLLGSFEVHHLMETLLGALTH